MKKSPLKIGWSEVDITPLLLPVAIAGQFPARVSESVKDPLKATVCALDSGEDAVIFVACDLVTISDALRGSVRELLGQEIPADQVIFNATHTHTGPELRGKSPFAGHTSSGGLGLDLGVVPVETYTAWLADRLVEAITEAWNCRKPGGVAYGMDYAVVGRNRRWVDADGVSTMYRLNAETGERFRHIEGFEDHSVNVLAVYEEQDRLTGIIVNLPCPSQEEGLGRFLSADFWHETRAELRKRFGEGLFILPQCSAAGDLTSHLLYEKPANERMLQLRNRTAREEIAVRIADAVGRVLPWLSGTIDRTPCLRHHTTMLDLPANCLTQQDADDAAAQAEILREQYTQELAKLEANPELRQQPRWYYPATNAFRRMNWHLGVVARYEHQKLHPTRPAEVHIVRLGEIAFASNPFEYYLDFGTQIKVRSPAIQTFLIQLAGEGTYVPSARSVVGGGYGSVPASNPVGPEGGQMLAEYTVEKLRDFFADTSFEGK